MPSSAASECGQRLCSFLASAGQTGVHCAGHLATHRRTASMCDRSHTKACESTASMTALRTLRVQDAAVRTRLAVVRVCALCSFAIPSVPRHLTLPSRGCPKGCAFRSPLMSNVRRLVCARVQVPAALFPQNICLCRCTSKHCVFQPIVDGISG